MAKATRTAIRESNRAKLVEAARAEFTERGYRETKIDAIAARAGLTRGAVYSNFPGKRALYFTVLAEDADTAPRAPTPRRPPAAPRRPPSARWPGRSCPACRWPPRRPT
ncbi:TetR/AcrR family transcriptional regulator [Actinokineospora soli]|uniref:TetR/AcrR family transcriptional regulator n=1 Tax=Actinokineospora soli TaxID=1048753 RepID=A0ABW2TTS7_9PSEU